MHQRRPMIIGNIPKLPVQWATVVIPFFVSCLMSALITLINMLRNLGWHEGFFEFWFQSWLISWLVAFPVVLLILPGIKKLTGIFVDIRYMQPPK